MFTNTYQQFSISTSRFERKSDKLCVTVRSHFMRI